MKAVAGKKLCPRCEHTKSTSGFVKNKNSSDGFYCVCRKCVAKQYLQNNSYPQLRAKHLKTEYGWTQADFDAKSASQQHLCAVCGLPESKTRLGSPKPLSVDHDHGTQKIRALLCGHCNRGLGHFKDNPSLLLKAAAYLQSHVAA